MLSDLPSIPEESEDEASDAVDSLIDLFDNVMAIEGQTNAPLSGSIRLAAPGEQLTNWTAQEVVRARKFR